MQKNYCDITKTAIEFEEDIYTITVTKASGKSGMKPVKVCPQLVEDFKTWLNSRTK